MVGLEVVAQRQLQNSVRVRLTSDLTKSGRIDIRRWVREVSVVAYVICVSPESDRMLFGPGHLELFYEGEVHVNESRSSQVVAIADLSAKRIAQSTESGRGICKIL